MNKKLLALATLPALGLFTSVALADVSGRPNASGNGITPSFPLEIKNRNQCTDGSTFFKNEFPSLTNGNPGGSKTNIYSVDGENVAVTVTWYANNSFDFSVDGGYATKVGATANNKDFVYDYSDSPLDGVADTQLNFYGANLTADDVNHLDLCLEPLDTDKPVFIGDISVVPTISDVPPPSTVSGPITISASIADESGQSVTIEIFEIVDGMEEPIDPSLISVPDEDPCVPAAPGCTKYTWIVDTGELDDGLYTIRITSQDQSILANTEVKTRDIEVITALEGCLEGDDAIPGGEDGTGGCTIPGITLEYPEALRGQLDPLPVTQLYIPARPELQTSVCGVDPVTGDIDPFVVRDPRVNPDGSVWDVRALNLNDVFMINETLAGLGVAGPFYGLVLGETQVGAVCVSVYYQIAPNFEDLAVLLMDPDFFLGFSLNAFENDPAGSPRTVSVLTQGPEDIAGMYAGSSRLTAPLNFCDRADSDCGTLPGCFENPGPNEQCYQPSQQFIERAVVQPDNNMLLIPDDSTEPEQFFAFDGTFEAYNRSRSTSFKGTFGVLNTRRVCPALEDPSSLLMPGTAEYLAEELECMVLQTLEVFYDTETAIKEADGRGNLISPNVTRLLNPHSKALGQIKNQHFDRALRYLDDLLDQIYRAQWNIDVYNDPGRLTMMVLALRFQVEQHLATETCLEDPACVALLDPIP